jgi:hypothetical protein
MLTDIRDIEMMLTEVFEQAKRDIIANHERAGQVASGKTRNSLSVEVTSDTTSATATMYGRKYFAALETGSAPWKKQYKHPPRPFVDTIQRWMDDKCIEGVSAYLVARKIMREGSKLYRDEGKQDIFTPVISDIEQRIDAELSSIFDTIIIKTLVL